MTKRIKQLAEEIIMSFRTAYHSLKNSRRTTKPQGYLRDPTPAEWKKTMDEYYIQQQKRKNGR
jgi:aspartyl aminopeptidase